MNIEEIKQAFQKQIELCFKEGIDSPLLCYMIKDKRIDIKRIKFDELDPLVEVLDGFEIEKGKEDNITPIFKRIGLE